MSIKNSFTDRDARGRIARKYTGPGRHGHGQGTPCWWTHQTIIRPNRRLSRSLCRAVLLGQIHPDEAIFPLGNRKPHEYYW